MTKSMKGEPEPPYDKAEEVVCGVDYNDERDEVTPPYLNDLRYDLATSYYWSGDFCRDYWFFVANWHPLLGIFCSHPLHPWTKSERALTFLVSCSLTLLPSAWLVSALHNEPKAARKATIFAFITLPAMLLEVALYWFAISDVYFQGSACCRPIAALVGAVKRTCFLVALLVSGANVALSLQWLGGLPPERMIHPFLVSRMQSWLIWFPVWFLMPCLGFFHYWSIERRSAPPKATERKSAQSERSGLLD